jgi:hypothetical protein
MAAAQHDLYSGAVLAPMVRCGTLPLRVLAIRMGANAVWGEEIIDKKLATCTRVENAELATVDFVASDGTIVFRTCPAIEKGRLVCQLGTADGATALLAARVVENDVDGTNKLSARACAVFLLMFSKLAGFPKVHFSVVCFQLVISNTAHFYCCSDCCICF